MMPERVDRRALVAGVFVREDSRHAAFIRRELEKTPLGTSRFVYDLKELRAIGVANPYPIFSETTSQGVRWRDSDEVARTVAPEYVGKRAHSLRALSQLESDEERVFEVGYRDRDGSVVVFSLTGRILLRDADGTPRLAILDVVAI